MRPAICGKASLAACCLALLTAASEDDGPVVEMSNAVIASRDEERLRVVFAAEGRPTLLFKPRGGAWDWRDASKIVISVENPGAEPVTLLLQVEDGADRSLSGKIAIAPGSTGALALWIQAPAPRAMGMIAGPWRVMPPSEVDRTAYQGIVDGFGQFHPGRWPEKVSSAEMLRARGAEEARELARQFALNPERDRFGGLFSGQTF